MRAVAVAAALAGLSLPALAQGIAVPEGVAPQVIAMDPEPGGVAFTLNGDGSGSAAGAGGTPGAGASTDGSSYSAGNTTAAGATGGSAVASGTYDTPQLATLAKQSYGAAAIQDAQNLNLNPNMTSSFAAAESGFRNVPASNGSTSALGVWQVTQPTWNDTVQRYDLQGMDRNDPADQAVVANRVMLQYAAATQNAIGRDATIAETYYSYVFGPSNGPRVIAASADTPLSDILPQRMLANNGMQNFTAGQLRQSVANRLGPAANQPALLPRS